MEFEVLAVRADDQNLSGRTYSAEALQQICDGYNDGKCRFIHEGEPSLLSSIMIGSKVISARRDDKGVWVLLEAPVNFGFVGTGTVQDVDGICVVTDIENVEGISISADSEQNG